MNAGLVPIFNGAAANSATADGLVSTFPGLTSSGGQAASSAAGARTPISVFANQSVGYSDNPGQIFAGSPSAGNRPDEYEVTNVGALLSRQLGLQDYFASANFGVTNYAHDTNFNSTQYSISVGDNYAFRDVCTGAIVANQSQSAVPLQFLQGSLSTETSQNSSFEVSSRCKATGHLFITTDVNISKSSFSDATSAANDSMQMFGSAGLEYAVPGFIVLGFLGSAQQSEFVGRGGLNVAGLANNTSQLNFNAFLTKPITPKLNLSLSAGIADLSAGGATLAGAIQPVYTASLSYAYSPKTSVNFNVSHLVGSPQNVLANFEQIDSYSFGLSYRYSARTNFGANFGVSKTASSGSMSGSGSSSQGVGTISPINLAATSGLDAAGLNTNNIFETFNVSYRLARAASASLSYQHLERQEAGLNQTAKANVVSLSVNYSR